TRDRIGFELLDDAEVGSPDGDPAARIFDAGARRVVTIQVRKGAVGIAVDEKKLTQLDDYGRLSSNPYWRLPRQDFLSLWTNNGDFLIHQIELRPVTGKGRILDRNHDEQSEKNRKIAEWAVRQGGSADVVATGRQGAFVFSSAESRRNG